MNNDDLNTCRKPNYVIGIGASAGGLEALEQFFRSVQTDLGVAFVVVQHLSPSFKSVMDEILSRYTKMRVLNAYDGIEVEADSVYLIPAGKSLKIEDNLLRVSEPEPSRTVQLPIDNFFKSLAEQWNHHAIGVVLSGTGSDGSKGIIDIHQAGGLVFIQTEESAKFDGMPKSARLTEMSDFILPPQEIPDAIASMVKGNLPAFADSHANKIIDAQKMDEKPSHNMALILQKLKEYCGIDFQLYKRETVHRRINRRLAMSQLEDLSDYLKLLHDNPEEADALYKDMLIGVTEFFRDPEVFEVVQSEVLTKILEQCSTDQEIRIWIPGCATGEEVYSLAILFDEYLKKHAPHRIIKIFATDAHEGSLDRAAAGIYAGPSLKNVSQERLKKYFIEIGNGRFQIIPEIRKLVVFARHNLLKDPPFTKVDFISCRNLLIYFGQAAQEKVLSFFYFALNAQGILLLGSSEGLSRFENEFETISQSSRIFRKLFDKRFSNDVTIPLILDRSTFPNTHRAKAVRPKANQLQVPQIYTNLLEKYVPSGFLIDEERTIVHTFGNTGQYLKPLQGRSDLDVLNMVDGQLKIALSAAINRASRTKESISYKGVRLKRDGEDMLLTVTIDPIKVSTSNTFYYHIVFTQKVNHAVTEAPLATAPDQYDFNESEETQSRIAALETELKLTKEQLQNILEQADTSNEELQSTNEEMLASNEELQSTNEELQSVNEELYTVNSEYERQNKELSLLNADMDNLLSSTEVGTLFIDKHLKIRKFTSAISQIFNLLPQDEDRPLNNLSHNLKNYETLFEDIQSVLETNQSIERKVCNYTDAWLLLKLCPYRKPDGEIDGVVLTFTDISNLAEIEASLRSAKNEADQLNKKLSVANQAKGDFLAMMSHEIRTPMNSIMGFAELLEHTRNAEESTQFTDSILKGCEHLKAIINDILDYARIDSNEVTFIKEPFVLIEHVKNILRFLSIEAEDKSLKLKLEVEESCPQNVSSDSQKLRQILTNIIHNAIKFTDEGSITVNISATPLNQTQIRVQFKITDTGCGISPKEIENIFDPFKQANLDVSRIRGGTGLGLAIAKRFVEGMKGTIQCESQIDAGSTFTFNIICDRLDKKAEPALVPENFKLEKTKDKPLQIVCAEDNPSNQKLVESVVNKLGHQLTIVDDGQKLIDEVVETYFDLVLMDLTMPRMNGIDATRKIRKEKLSKNPEIPIVGMTAHAFEGVKDECFEAGMDEYIPKPVSLKRLGHCLEMIQKNLK